MTKDQCLAAAYKKFGKKNKGRERAYMDNKYDFDYYGIAAVGDVQYDDGFDYWDDVKEAFNNSKEIPIFRSHQEKESIGLLKYWEINPLSKYIAIGFNRNDINVDLHWTNQVSPDYKVDQNGRIIGVNHIAIGNSFKQKCDTEVCKITRNRGTELSQEEIEKISKEVEQELTEKDKIIKDLQEKLTLLEEEQKTKEAPEEPKEEPQVEEVKEKEVPAEPPKLGFSEEQKSEIETRTDSEDIGVFRKMELTNITKNK